MLRLDIHHSQGVPFEMLAGDLQRFARNASPATSAWSTYHRVVMHDAYRRGDLETLRSHFAAAEKVALIKWDYAEAAHATVWLLHAEDELQKTAGEVNIDRLCSLASRALAHAEHSGERGLLASVTATIQGILPDNES